MPQEHNYKHVDWPSVVFPPLQSKNQIGNDAKGERKNTGLRQGKKIVFRRKEEPGEASGGEEMSAFAR